MVEGVIDSLRRGFRALLSLWPLLLVRLVETITIIVVMLGGVALAMIPVGLSFDFGDVETWTDEPEVLAESLAEWLVSNVGTFVFFLIVLTVLVGIAVLIHSYFEAGVAALYLDHIRAGASIPVSEAWARFSLDAFVKAALSRGWSVFLVYNIVWGVAGAVILIPAGLLLAVILLFRESAAAIAFTCLGLAVVLFVSIISSIVATVWAQIALTIAAGDRLGPIESSGLAGEMIRARLGVTILTAICVFAVIFGISTVTSTFNLALSVLAEVPGAEMVAFMFQVVLFLVNTVVSTVLGLWSGAVWAAFVASGATSTKPALDSSGGSLGSERALVG